MEVLVTVVSLLLAAGLFISPIFFFIRVKRNKTLRHSFLFYLGFGIISTALMMLLFAWWSDYSNTLLMEYYGVELDALNHTEKYQNVEAKQLDNVIDLEKSIGGIGWPLKAIINYLFYLPYLLIVYGTGSLIYRIKRK